MTPRACRCAWLPFCSRSQSASTFIRRRVCSIFCFASEVAFWPAARILSINPPVDGPSSAAAAVAAVVGSVATDDGALVVAGAGDVAMKAARAGAVCAKEPSFALADFALMYRRSGVFCALSPPAANAASASAACAADDNGRFGVYVEVGVRFLLSLLPPAAAPRSLAILEIFAATSSCACCSAALTSENVVVPAFKCAAAAAATVAVAAAALADATTAALAASALAAASASEAVTAVAADTAALTLPSIRAFASRIRRSAFAASANACASWTQALPPGTCAVPAAGWTGVDDALAGGIESLGADTGVAASDCGAIVDGVNDVSCW